MNNKNFGIAVASLSFGITCLLITGLHIAAYKQEVRENDKLRQEIIDYKWQLEQVDQMICSDEEGIKNDRKDVNQ